MNMIEILYACMMKNLWLKKLCSAREQVFKFKTFISTAGSRKSGKHKVARFLRLFTGTKMRKMRQNIHGILELYGNLKQLH